MLPETWGRPRTTGAQTFECHVVLYHPSGSSCKVCGLEPLTEASSLVRLLHKYFVESTASPSRCHPKDSKTLICWMVYAIRTAFCSDTPLHKNFVEPTTPPSRLDPKTSEKHSFTFAGLFFLMCTAFCGDTPLHKHFDCIL